MMIMIWMQTKLPSKLYKWKDFPKIFQTTKDLDPHFIHILRFGPTMWTRVEGSGLVCREWIPRRKNKNSWASCHVENTCQSLTSNRSTKMLDKGLYNHPSPIKSCFVSLGKGLLSATYAIEYCLPLYFVCWCWVGRFLLYLCNRRWGLDWAALFMPLT